MEKQWHARRQNNPERQKTPTSTVITFSNTVTYQSNCTDPISNHIYSPYLLIVESAH